MNRTWDTPELYLRGDADPVSACPSLAAAVANYAIRGAVSPVVTSPLGVDVQQIPSFEATLDFLTPAIEDQVNYGQNDILATVFEDDVRAALVQRATIFNTLAAGVTEPYLINYGDTLEESRERFTLQLADVMMDPDERRQLVNNADAYLRAKSDKIIETIRTQSIDYDVIIKGGGVHTANVVATLQECVPGIRMLVINDGSSKDIDGQPRLGGQFRYYGDIPVFDMNSGTGEVLDIGGVYGLPKNGGNLNSLGLHSPLQLPDFVATDLPTNVDPAEAAALVIALSGADVVYGDVVQQNRFSDMNYVNFNDDRNISLRPFISPEPVLEITGVGRPSDSNDGYESIKGIDRLFREFGMHRPGTPHPLEQYAGKTVLGAGCGDTMKALYKLLFGQGPEAAYRGWSARRGRIALAYWVAPEFDTLGLTKQEYKSGVRPIYASLSRFFSDPSNPNGRIRPIAGRLDFNGQGFIVRSSDGSVSPAPAADVIFRGTGVKRDRFIDYLRDRLIDYGQYEEDIFGSQYALRSFGRPYESQAESIGVGPVSSLSVNDDAGVPANTISIWSRAPASTITAYWIANRVRARRQV